MVSRSKTNAAAVARTVRELAKMGRLESVDAAVITMAEGLAHAVDAEPSNAALWRELRAAINTLREVGTDGADDDTAAFLALISTPAMRPEVGDT